MMPLGYLAQRFSVEFAAAVEVGSAVGSGAVIGMGAVVVAPVPANAMVMGNPARSVGSPTHQTGEHTPRE